MASVEFDVLIIGTGVAGLSAAMALSNKCTLKIGVMTKADDPMETNTYWAQGGIIYTKNYDEQLVEDIFKASAGTSSLEAARLLATRSGKILEDVLLMAAETNFCRDEQGELKYTQEGAHSKARIVYKGDFTGRSIQTSMMNYLEGKLENSGISMLTSHVALDLITPSHHGVSMQQRYEEEQVVGVYSLNCQTGQVIKIMAKKVVLATGGIGAIYLHHTNSEGARGDGIAMAKRAGAALTDLEFIQFHPTTFFDRSSHRRFLISEAVRGEGGILVNSEEKPFMKNYHHDKELAPRDVVSRAIVTEMVKTHHDCVYLDISHKDSEWIKQRFPSIYEHCLSKHVDITIEPIPVVPAAHYLCGGIKSDLKGRTTLKNLYAVGEVACTGLHGANRLASTSLLEGLTMGQLAAQDVMSSIDSEEMYPSHLIKDWKKATGACDMALIQQDWMTLKHTMWNYVGLMRSGRKLKRAQAMLTELSDEIDRFYKNSALNDQLIGLRNAVTVARIVQENSLRNKESVGCFYRED